MWSTPHLCKMNKGFSSWPVHYAPPRWDLRLCKVSDVLLDKGREGRILHCHVSEAFHYLAEIINHSFVRTGCPWKQVQANSLLHAVCFTQGKCSCLCRCFSTSPELPLLKVYTTVKIWRNYDNFLLLLLF